MAYPYLGKGIVVASSSDLAKLLFDEIIRAVALEYDWPEDFVHHVATVALDGSPSDYSGIYPYLSRRNYRVIVRNGRLFGQEDREYESALLPVGSDRFVSEVYGTELNFERNTEGRVVGLTLQWQDDPEVYEASREAQ